MINDTKLYVHKPAKIRNVHDLIAFVKGIPEEYWCVDTRDNYKGQRCILGHLDLAYDDKGGSKKNTDGFTQTELAVVNNGVHGPHSGVYVSGRIKGAGLDGLSIKSRLLTFLKAKV